MRRCYWIFCGRMFRRIAVEGGRPTCVMLDHLGLVECQWWRMTLILRMRNGGRAVLRGLRMLNVRKLPVLRRGQVTCGEHEWFRRNSAAKSLCYDGSWPRPRNCRLTRSKRSA